MHDIRWIKSNLEIFQTHMSNRGEFVDIKKILELDESRRQIIMDLQGLQKERNQRSKVVGQIEDKSGEEFKKAREGVQAINRKADNLREKEREIEEEFEDFLSRIPNILDKEVPEGKDESSNKIVSEYGAPNEFDFEPKPHFELGEDLGMMDFEQTAKISGSRFVTLKGSLSAMERALANFMIDTHTKKFSFQEISPTFLVKSDAMYGTGQLPKFTEDSFETKDGMWLIPTSEVPLTNMVAGNIINKEALPLRYVAYTPCFRSEAGSAGKDTRI